ncbi:alpha/beta hydrolase [Nubsella zeaxanthinifaciens]|uniref:alpha/beta hydrolase n=1 Tax=Nubsella zeaxanthinifaciens TaxID=392412 RepID=UPI003CFFB62A
MKKVYIFSGLGADERVFKYLDLTGLEVTFVKWIKPQVNEILADYAKRLSTQIKDENPILIGLSFGGIVATEMSKIIPTDKLILLSSLKTRNEIPLLYRIAGKLNLHKIIPYSLLKSNTFFNHWLFGIIRKNDKDLFQKVLADTDIDFLRWAINVIVKWDSQMLHPQLYHIHGSKDKILPIRNAGNVIVIENGRHLMVLDKAKQVSEALHKII